MKKSLKKLIMGMVPGHFMGVMNHMVVPVVLIMVIGGIIRDMAGFNGRVLFDVRRAGVLVCVGGGVWGAGVLTGVGVCTSGRSCRGRTDGSYGGREIYSWNVHRVLGTGN